MMASKAVVPGIRSSTSRAFRRCTRFKSTYQDKGSFPLKLPHNFEFSASSVTYFPRSLTPESDTRNGDTDTERTIPVENPATGEIIQDIACASTQTIDDSINYAHKVFTNGAWSCLPLTTRYQTLINISNLLRESRNSLAALETLQTGRPIREMTAQLDRIPEWFEYHASLMRTHETQVLPFKGNILNYTKWRPLGTVALITPWNHPLLITIKKLAPALAAGNSIIIKPSEKAPLSVQYFVSEILSSAGIPAGTVQVLLGDGKVGSQIVSHKKIHRIDFTGGTSTGRSIASLAGHRLIPMTAELGGKSAMVICADCDVERAVEGVLAGGFIASGQTCVTGSRIIVQEEIYNRFVERLVQRTGELKIGRPWEFETQIGAVIDAEAVRRCERYISTAEKEGARILVGGKAVQVDGKGYFFQPTLLGDCEPWHTSVREEIFGPILSILKSSKRDLLETVSSKCEYTLAASIWTKSLSTAHSMARDIEAGIVWINAHHLNDPSSPWGGWGASGLGRENGLTAFKDNHHERSVIVNLDERMPGWFEKDDARYS